jgi:hypothetical protein
VDGLADALPLVDAVGVALRGAVVAPPVGCFVGLDARGFFVGVGLGFGCEAVGAAGATPGGSPPPFCQENATLPPAGIVSEPTDVLAYFQPPEPSDQYRPQYASAGEVFTQGSDAGAPSTRHTNPGWRWA